MIIAPDLEPAPAPSLIRISVLERTPWLPVVEEDEPLLLTEDDIVVTVGEAMAFLARSEGVEPAPEPEDINMRHVFAYDKLMDVIAIVGTYGVRSWCDVYDSLSPRITSDGREHNEIPERAE